MTQVADPQVTDQPDSSTTTQPTDERIQALLESADVYSVAKQPEVEAHIQKQFEHKSEKLLSKLGPAWGDVRDAYSMSFDKAFNLGRTSLEFA